MSASSLGVNAATGAPITISGLASGLETSKIIGALMGVEREPVAHLTTEQEKIQAEQSQLQQIRSSLQQVATAASEFALPSLFESVQGVTSSEPARVSAVAKSGAGVGGYEVEVTQLANSAQRTFTFKSPASEQKLTIEGHEFTLKAGESAKELASAIDSSASATVYAAVLEDGSIVLSNRATGSTGSEYIKVTGEALSEKAGTAREGKNAEYTVDGVEGSSTSNTVVDAIPGITLTFGGLTAAGPVTIDVEAPGPSVSAIEAHVQAFVNAYNSAVEAVQAELAAKPPVKPTSGELGVGALFGDIELTSLLNNMRDSMYEAIAGLEPEMSSPLDVGLSTGQSTGAGVSTQSSLEGLLTLDPTKLAEAVKANPTGSKQMLEQWSQKLQGLVNAVSGPGGSLESRISGDEAQVTQLGSQIATMNEMLAHREKALQATYAALEGVISRNSTQAAWLTSQEESLSKSGG
ncbi:MAG: flagellar hook-associated 2 domain protein [Solirubrobacterales bacterium]|nr:flagellar hook-associated 2 domain protein [Solirubrobacterales bacterium]